jgi:hypothetical protein
MAWWTVHSCMHRRACTCCIQSMLPRPSKDFLVAAASKMSACSMICSAMYMGSHTVPRGIFTITDNGPTLLLPPSCRCQLGRQPGAAAYGPAGAHQLGGGKRSGHSQHLPLPPAAGRCSSGAAPQQHQPQLSRNDSCHQQGQHSQGLCAQDGCHHCPVGCSGASTQSTSTAALATPRSSNQPATITTTTNIPITTPITTTTTATTKNSPP